jgi:hypothetical protein
VHLDRSARFDEEARRFHLEFTCDECGHFDRARGACAHEWPTLAHRRAHYDTPSEKVTFCKEFEAR